MEARSIRSAKRPGRFGQILAILRKNKIQQGINPVKFRVILEELGPTYVKIGQIMASRQDMFSQRYCKELEKLRDHVAPMPFEDALGVLDAQYGNWQNVFERINPEPLGSASIAQVHEAWLKDGRRVVVKIQRPGIYEQMEEDVRMIRKAAKLLQLSDVLSSVVDLNMVIDEFWTAAKEEMDFEQEAANGLRFQKEHVQEKDIIVPHIYPEYSGREILVMDYAQGCTIEDVQSMEAQGINSKQAALRIADSFLDQVMNKGFFHADPHSGNLRLLKEGIVWIDFGMMGTLTDRDRRLMKEGVAAAAARQSGKMADVIITLGVSKKRPDRTALANDLDAFMDAYAEESLEDMDVVAMIQEIFAICHRHRISLPKGISMLARSLVTLEGTMQKLDPSLSIMDVLKQKKGKTLQEIKDQAVKTAQKSGAAFEAGLDIPVRLSDVLQMAQRGQIRLNLNLTGSEGAAADMDRMVNRLVICILIAALLMGSSIICTTNMKPQFLGIPLLGFLGFFTAFCMSFWLFIKMLFLHQKNKPF